jgi:argininosuccinate lyase
MTAKTGTTLWGGRFAAAPDDLLRQFGDSLPFDLRLAAVDVRGSIAYAEALRTAGVIDASECDRLVAGLAAVGDELEAGTVTLEPGDEDVHTLVERLLTERIGPVAGKLHTGRSRNDQVATDLRLYLLDEIAALGSALSALQEAMVEKAESHRSVVMPGYTHQRTAQPVLFSHWMLSHVWKLLRDGERLAELAARTAVCPLGSGALAGTPYPIDRDALAGALGFVSASENSLDAVEDRDFVAEFLTWAAMLQVHLSGLAETLIVWSSEAYGFIQLSEAYATGSSLMPQKRNPDSLELVRGKAGRMIGHATAFLCTLKGLPSGYNKDLQEDKEGLFDAIDALKLELPLLSGLIRSLRVRAAHMAAARNDAMLATDLADYLVFKGVPFREAHVAVGGAVRRAEREGVPLVHLKLEKYQAVHPAFEADLYDVFDPHRSVAARSAKGGTAGEAVEVQIEAARVRMDVQNKQWAAAGVAEKENEE